MLYELLFLSFSGYQDWSICYEYFIYASIKDSWWRKNVFLYASLTQVTTFEVTDWESVAGLDVDDASSVQEDDPALHTRIVDLVNLSVGDKCALVYKRKQGSLLLTQVTK